MPYLYIICGATKGLRLALTQQDVTIGRESSNAITVDDPAVSIRHCVLSREGEGYRVRVAGSASGVTLNGQPVTDELLHHGDIIVVGPAEFIYCSQVDEPDAWRPGGDGSHFSPEPPPLSLAGRLFWPFSLAGRARHRLLLAHRFPDDPHRVADVKTALDAMSAGLAKLSPAGQALRADLLVYLAWKSLACGETMQAAEYLLLVDDSFLAAEAKAALRWDLMGELWGEGSWDAYGIQAGLLLADAPATAPEWADVIPGVVQAIYERLSPAVCGSVLSKAHATLMQRPPLQAALALCACPEDFDHAAEATKWTAQIRPEDLAFSKIMAADAHLVAARAAEVQGDWAGMLNSCLHALRLAPAHSPVLYWLARAKLHDAKANPLDHLADAVSGDPRWDRLVLLFTLHQSPSVANADATRRMVEGKLGKLAQPEVLLLVELVRHALEAAPASSPPDIETAAELCLAVQKRVGTLPWTQVPVAHKAVRLDREFKSAYELLEQRDIADQPGARRLARVARILAGTPQRPQTSSPDDALTAIELAMFQLLDAAAAHAAPGAMAIFQGLSVHRQDAVHDQFPDLQWVTDVLLLASRVVNRDFPATYPDLQAMRLPDHAPTWLAWLYARICLLARDYAAPAERMPGVIHTAIPAVAWAVDRWARNQSRSEAKDEIALTDVYTCLDRWAPTAAGKAKLVISVILAARKSAYRAFAGDDTRAKIASVHADLGDLADAICAAELCMELRYACARRAISTDKPADAAAELASLDEGMDQLPDIASMWWRPLVRYWLGVAHARQRDGTATAILQELVDGPRGNEARGQLALLAMLEGQADVASRWLAGASDLVPSVRYARALVLTRRCNHLEARQLLVSENGVRVLAGSTYAVPAQRLAAAIEERSGNKEESDRLYSVILEAHPDDVVAGIRLGRSLLESGYAQFRIHRTLDGAAIGNLLQNHVPSVRTEVPWWHPYALLSDLLNAPVVGLPDLAKRVESRHGIAEQNLAWRQVLAARFVKGTQPEAALQILEVAGLASRPHWFDRARLLLRIWQGLARLADNADHDDAVRSLEQCLQVPASLWDGDATANQWRVKAELGTAIGRGAQPVHDELLDQLSGSCMAHIFLLFGGDLKRRRGAAEALLPIIETDGARWNEEQKLLLQALAAWAMEKDDAYIEHYSYLESVLEELPIHARDLWTPAALVRYSRSDWKSLTGSSLPECLADMSDPLVCLILELADARATVGDMKNPNQRVAQKVKGIYNNLAALVERLDNHHAGDASPVSP